MSNPIAPFSFTNANHRRSHPYDNIDLPTKKPHGNMYARQQSSGSGKGQPAGQPVSTSARTGSGPTTRLPPGAFGSPTKVRDIKPSLHPEHTKVTSISSSSTPQRPEGATTAAAPPKPSSGSQSHRASEEMSSVSRSKSMSGGVGHEGGAGTKGGPGLKGDPDERDAAAFGIATGTGKGQASFQSQNQNQSSSFQTSFQKGSSRTSAPAAAQPSNPLTFSDSAPTDRSHPESRRQLQHSHLQLSRPTSDRYQEYPDDQRIKQELADYDDPRQAAIASSHALPRAESEQQRPSLVPLSTGTGPTQAQPASDVFGQVGPGQSLPSGQQYSYNPPASHAHAQRDVKPFLDHSNHDQSSYSETKHRAQGSHQLAQFQPQAYAPHHPQQLSASESLAIKQERHTDTTLLTERERSSSLSLPYPGHQWVGVQEPAEETTPMWKAMQIQEQHFQKQINKIVSRFVTRYLLPSPCGDGRLG